MKEKKITVKSDVCAFATDFYGFEEVAVLETFS